MRIVSKQKEIIFITSQLIFSTKNAIIIIYLQHYVLH